MVDALAVDDGVHGILVQLPLPRGLDTAAILEHLPVDKDVDGLTTLSQGRLARNQPGLRPCTPRGVLELLDSAKVQLEGADVVVIGRSELVGRPVAQMLVHRNATVTVAHSRTTDLSAHTRAADILVVEAGVPGLVGAKHVRPGATVIDVGIHRTESGLVGDVRTDDLEGIAAHVTPVPGGVGPMTIAMLLANTYDAAVAQR